MLFYIVTNKKHLLITLRSFFYAKNKRKPSFEVSFVQDKYEFKSTSLLSIHDNMRKAPLKGVSPNLTYSNFKDII